MTESVIPEEDLPHLQTLIGIKERSGTELRTATQRVSVAGIRAEYQTKAAGGAIPEFGSGYGPSRRSAKTTRRPHSMLVATGNQGASSMTASSYSKSSTHRVANERRQKTTPVADAA